MLAYRAQVEGYFRRVVDPHVATPPRVSPSKDDVHITEHLVIYGYSHTLSTLKPPATMELGHNHTLKVQEGVAVISCQAHCLPQRSFYVAALAINRGFLTSLILGHSCSREDSGYDALRETLYNHIFFFSFQKLKLHKAIRS